MQKGQKMSHINNDLMTRTIDDKHILDVSSRGPSTHTTTKVFWAKLTLERAQYLDTGSIMCQYKPAEGIDVSKKNYIKNI